MREPYEAIDIGIGISQRKSNEAIRFGITSFYVFTINQSICNESISFFEVDFTMNMSECFSEEIHKTQAEIHQYLSSV